MQVVGREEAAMNLQIAVRNALSAAQVKPEDIIRGCAGVSGFSHPEVAGFVKEALAEVVAAEIVVTGDHIIAYEAAFRGGPGLLIIAGSGSIAYGRNEKGLTARAGGWGPVVSDEGSGLWIGRAAVANSLRAFDAGQNTMLLHHIMTAWHLATRDDVVRVANSNPWPNFAALFPEVLSAAESGDTIAKEVLNRAGGELAHCAKIVIRKLWPKDVEVRICCAGGVLRNSTQVRQVVHNVICAERPHALFNESVIEPVAGALFLAENPHILKS